jgi:hypothetical protein
MQTARYGNNILLYVHGWLITSKNSVAFDYAVLPHGMPNSEMIISQKEFIVIAIDRLSAILPIVNTSNLWTQDGVTGRKMVSGSSGGWIFRWHLVDYKLHHPDNHYHT